MTICAWPLPVEFGYRRLQCWEGYKKPQGLGLLFQPQVLLPKDVCMDRSDSIEKRQ